MIQFNSINNNFVDAFVDAWPYVLNEYYLRLVRLQLIN